MYIQWTELASKLFTTVFPDARTNQNKFHQDLMDEIERYAKDQDDPRVYEEHVVFVFNNRIIASFNK